MNVSKHSMSESSDTASEQPPEKLKRNEELPCTNECYYQKTFAVLNVMRKKNLFCDVVLVTNDIEIPAHRVILAACSSYFHAIFSRIETNRIEVKEIGWPALESLIEYIYTAEILVTKKNVRTLLPAANLLQFSAVKNACCVFLERQLNLTNCLSISALAKQCECWKLAEAADTFVDKHISEVMVGEEFLSLPVNRVVEIIESDTLKVPAEEEVFECVMNWVRHDVKDRQTHLPLLMKHVRLPLTSKEYLSENVSQEPLLRSNLQCSEYVIEAQRYHLLSPKQRALIHTIRTNPRQYIEQKAFLVIGGQSPNASVEYYDLWKREWYAMCNLPSERCYANLAVLGNKVYVVGGLDSSCKNTNDVFVYDIQAGQWSVGVPMNEKRATSGIAVLNNMLYVIGGYCTDNSTLELAEVFNPETQCWKAISCMHTSRASFGVAILDNRLYAVGGYKYTSESQSFKYHDSVEFYDLEKNVWCKACEMLYKREGVGVGVLNGILYAVGGYDGTNIHNSAEAYDPSTNSWRQIASMAWRRKNAGVVSYNGKLYAIGGSSGLTSLTCVEVYCPLTDTWSVLPRSMNIARSYVRVALVNKPLSYKNSTTD